MRTVTTDTFVEDVRTAIDENTDITAFVDDENTEADTDTLEMEDIIRAKIPDGINAVRKTAPLSMLQLTQVAPTVTWINEAKGIGRVPLPDDYMRLALFRMSDWHFGVTEAISPTADSYAQQFSDYVGVRGNPSRPVVALSADPDTGKAALEFFSSASTVAKATLLYVPRQTATADSYDVEEAIYRAAVLKTASLIMANYGNSDLMKLLDTLVAEQLS